MHRVAVGVTTPSYNTTPPFHPDTSFPELPFSARSDQPNPPYHLLRDLLCRLGYDRDRFGSKEWNPFGTFIQPGQTVALKPNFVTSRNIDGKDLFAAITHPSILRALIDYVYIALKGQGRIIVADAPQMDCDWEQLMAQQQMEAIRSFYRQTLDFDIEIYDLRDFALIDPDEQAYASNRKPLQGDPMGNVIINLSRRSEFFDLPSNNYYGADFDRKETLRHHHDDIHEYSVSKTVLSADVVIFVPKMKVHKKVGVTLNLKGLVGINTNKNYLIHYRLGTPSTGGDQLPDGLKNSDQRIVRIRRWFYDRFLARQDRFGDRAYQAAQNIYRTFLKPFRKVSEATLLYDGGNWFGNDSAWRMTVDLAGIILYADAQGRLHDSPQRKIFCLIDGIIGGENDGPLAPDAKPAGCLVAGHDPLAVDIVAARMMGFDFKKIKQFSRLLERKMNGMLSSPSDIQILFRDTDIPGDIFFSPDADIPCFNFQPHSGWTGKLEV